MKSLAFCLISAAAVALTMGPQSSEALPALMARATDSISALLSASGRSAQPQLAQPQVQQQVGPIAPAQMGQEQLWTASSSNSSAGAAIQAQFGAIQAQAQRQLNQLVGGTGSLSSAAANSNSTSANRYGSQVLEVLSSVGKAIQQQISGNGQIQIMNSLQSGQLAGSSQQQQQQPFQELANTKKNEYQSIVITDPQQQQQGQLSQIGGGSSITNQTTINNNREQSEQLRQEILRRVGQLQQVVASSMDLLKNNGDLIVRRLLEQLNHRLDQAKAKADKIISEPATNEVAIKALSTINQGLNNLNNIITNIVTKLELSAKEANQHQDASGGLTQRGANSGPSGASAGLLLDPARFKVNLHQLGQQFSSAISAVQQQRQLQQQQQQFQLQQKQQQQQQAANIVSG